MAAISGAVGAINGIPNIMNWTVTTTAALPDMVTSGASGGTIRIAGNGDWSGSYNSEGAVPTQLPGDSFTFTGSMDETNGATGDAMVSRVLINVPVAEGGAITHTVEFGSNGTLTLGAAAATDATVPSPESAIGCKLNTGTMIAVPVWTEIPDVTSMSIELVRANPVYHSSTTGATAKRFEGNLDARVTVGVIIGDPADLPAVNAVAGVQAFINATEYWEFKWAYLESIDNVTVDPSTRAPVSCNLNFAMTAVAEIAAVWTKGTIKKPDTTTYWPS